MRWLRAFITITAILSITLPIPVFAAQCDEKSWNQSLTFQKRVDAWYNQQATKYNDFLSLHKQRVLLHQQFSELELRRLWRTQKRIFINTMNAQIQAANETVSQLDQQIHTVSDGADIIDKAITRWRSINQQCEKHQQFINSATSLNYIQANQILKLEQEKLVSKLNQLKRIYQYEADLLTKTQQ